MRALLLAGLLLASACTSTDPRAPSPAASEAPAPPEPPAVPDGPLDEVTVDALEHRFWLTGRPRPGDLDRIAAAEDVRLAWPLVDLLRFEQESADGRRTLAALASLTGVEATELGDVAAELHVGPERAWVVYSELLLAWDVPAPPDYLRYKAAQHRIFDQRWDPFFDPAAGLDWRYVSWGGVPRDGIPDLMDPEAVAADAADHLEPEDVVFGLEVGDDTRAYPRRIVEVHEVVNDELGDTRIVLPFCTLCGVATAYRAELTGPGAELVDGALEFGTSGLLVRSNKLMHDRQTESLFQQFTGRAVTGPMARAGAELERLPLTITTWSDWWLAHPDTTVLALPRGEDPSRYDGSFLADGGDDTRSFPSGPTDDRLPPKALVLGVEEQDGSTVAFPLDAAQDALAVGQRVELGDVHVRREAGTLVAVDADGRDLSARQAFWFAWSQFHPRTRLWEPPSS